MTRNFVTPDVMMAVTYSAGIGLSAVTSKMERVMGIEPTLSAWEAEVLPLNYTRLPYHTPATVTGGGGRIRTYEGIASRFTVCPR